MDSRFLRVTSGQSIQSTTTRSLWVVGSSSVAGWSFKLDSAFVFILIWHLIASDRFLVGEAVYRQPSWEARL